MAYGFTTDTTQWAIAEEGVYVENPEFIYVKTDAKGRILWAIKANGDIHYGAGVPQQVINYINELLNKKVDGEYVDNPEFIEAKVDSNNRILEAIARNDGSKILPAGIDIDGIKVNTSKNSEFIGMWLDSKNRVVLAVKKNADIYFGFGIPSQIAEYIDNIVGNIDVDIESKVKEEVMDNLISDFSSFISQTDLLIDTIGISNFKEKVITVISPDKYSCWPRIGVVNNKLVCIYVKCLEHTDPHNGYGALHSSVSSNGVLWTPQITVIDTPNMRDGITGRGNDSDGNLLIINRVGFPSHPNTFNEIYKTSDGLNFEKISTIPSSSVLGHAGDIINIPTKGLASFFGTYPRNGVCSYGYILSQDNGVTWDRIVIEQDITQEETPMEMSGAYIGEGKILIVGRFEGSGSGHMWQLQSEYYGNTWSKVATNIAGNSNSPSMIYNSESDKIYLYIYNRSNGRLEYREVNTSDVWNNPSNWPAATNIAQGATGQDAGNVSTVMFKGLQVAVYYSGNSVDTGIYSILK